MARTPPTGLSTPASRRVEQTRAKTVNDPAPTGMSAPQDRKIEELRSPLDYRVEELLSQYERVNPLPQGCTKIGRQGVAGLSVAGCMVAGLDLGYR